MTDRTVRALEEAVQLRNLDADDVAAVWVQLARDYARMIDAGRDGKRIQREYAEVLEVLHLEALLSDLDAAPVNVSPPSRMSELRSRKLGPKH